MQPTDKNFQAFCESHDLCSLMKGKTCFRSIEGTCFDLILTNQKYFFKTRALWRLESAVFTE